MASYNDAGWSSLEARRAHNYAQIAQLVEQRTENPRVAGSIPALGMFFFSYAGFLHRFFL